MTYYDEYAQFGRYLTQEGLYYDKNGWLYDKKGKNGKRVKKLLQKPLGEHGPRIWMPIYNDLKAFEVRRWNFCQRYARMVMEPYSRAFDALAEHMGESNICFIDEENPELYICIIRRKNGDSYSISIRNENIKEYSLNEGPFIDDPTLVAKVKDFLKYREIRLIRQLYLDWFNSVFYQMISDKYKERMRTIFDNTYNPVVMNLEINNRIYVIAYGLQDKTYDIVFLHTPENSQNFIQERLEK